MATQEGMAFCNAAVAAEENDVPVFTIGTAFA